MVVRRWMKMRDDIGVVMHGFFMREKRVRRGERMKMMVKKGEGVSGFLGLVRRENVREERE